MIFLFLTGCQSLSVDIYGQMHEGTVDVSWDAILYRSEKTDWFDPWDEIPKLNDTQSLHTSPILLSTATLPSQPYVHLFTDATVTYQNEQEIADIIEPIACPIEWYGHYQITITYIVIQEQIFAMDCDVTR